MNDSQSRLDPPMGILIDRDSPVEFEFEGHRYWGFAGDTVASALLANGCGTLSRSFKYHRRRGVLTLAGQDANTLVQLPEEPNVLADRLPITPGLKVSGQNYHGSLERDRYALLGRFGRILPAGFYYRTFFRPRGSWKLWEPMIRRLAGLGRLNLSAKPRRYDKVNLFSDIVIIGAGPAGMQAARTAADAGASVLLIEEEPVLGGSLAYARFAIDPRTGDRQYRSLVGAIDQHPNIQVLTNAVCTAWFSDHYLSIIQGARLLKIRARQCIVAAGSFEQPAIFRNNDLPGIMLSSAALRLMKGYGIRPGRRAVVLTGNDDGYLAALQLAEHSIEVAAVIDMRPHADTEALDHALSARGILLLREHGVFEAFAAPRTGQLQAIDVRPILAPGRLGSAGQHIECDLLCMACGYMPVYPLLCQAGGRLEYDDALAEFRISNLPDGLHIAGSVNARHNLVEVLADGRRAAGEALRAMGLAADSELPVQCRTPPRRVNYPWPIFPHPKGKEFVDFDEDLQISDIINTTRLGYRDLQLVKRYSTVGMGPSQGRHSALATARLVARVTGRSVTETGVATARPPFAPEKLGHLAGPRFDPVRHTPMHARHLALGATMMPAGHWLRPAFYGEPTARHDRVREEAIHVRTRVGLIDVSTLGGLEIRGPDSAELLARIYTGPVARLPVGRARYVIATNEQGVIYDDGVACRLGKDHYYVSATTTGVDRLYRDMTRWNAQWRLDVDIANVTSAFAAVNLAGPDSRKVLRKLCPDTALDGKAFLFMAYRGATVADIAARLLRVGFVGELGFEIHVPARYGEQLWDALMEAGSGFDLRPFGVEAQRLLRLEKGHLIVGQDTDGMTHPGQVGLEWALDFKKPFFVGRRSIEILNARMPTRKLVGFRLPAQSARPAEGHLILNHGEISGSVTSCDYSPTLDATIGLAYVDPVQAVPDQRLPIRIDGGRIVQAVVVEPPFYDPDNNRQKVQDSE